MAKCTLGGSPRGPGRQWPCCPGPTPEAWPPRHLRTPPAVLVYKTGRVLAALPSGSVQCHPAVPPGGGSTSRVTQDKGITVLLGTCTAPCHPPMTTKWDCHAPLPDSLSTAGSLWFSVPLYSGLTSEDHGQIRRQTDCGHRGFRVLLSTASPGGLRGDSHIVSTLQGKKQAGAGMTKSKRGVTASTDPGPPECKA